MKARQKLEGRRLRLIIKPKKQTRGTFLSILNKKMKFLATAIMAGYLVSLSSSFSVNSIGHSGDFGRPTSFTKHLKGRQVGPWVLAPLRSTKESQESKTRAGTAYTFTIEPPILSLGVTIEESLSKKDEGVVFLACVSDF